VRNLETLCGFCGLTASMVEIQHAAGFISQDRACALRGNPLESFPAGVAGRAGTET
jgi:hypothetical protein